MSAPLAPTNADLLNVQYGTVPYAVFAVSIVEFIEGNADLEQYGNFRGSDAAEELGRSTLLTQWWNCAAAQALGVSAYRKTRSYTLFRQITQKLFASLDPGLGRQISACLIALSHPQTAVCNVQAMLSPNFNVCAQPCRFIERRKCQTRAGKRLGAFFKLCFRPEPANNTMYNQHNHTEPSKLTSTGALATLLLLLPPTAFFLPKPAAELMPPNRLTGSQQGPSNDPVNTPRAGQAPLLMGGATPLDTLCLSGLPLCVTIFLPNGRIYHQNAASMEYFGRRTSPQLSGAADTTACTAAAAVVPKPTPASSTSPLTQSVHPDGYALQELLLGSSNPGPNFSNPGGRPDGQGATAGDCDVLHQLFAMERGKLEQMLAATLEAGGVWEGIVRVPASLNPDGPPPSASTSMSEEMQSTTHCLAAAVGLGQRHSALPPIADSPIELPSAEDLQPAPYNHPTVNDHQPSHRGPGAGGHHGMALPSFDSTLQTSHNNLHNALLRSHATGSFRRAQSTGEESLVQLPTPGGSPRANSRKGLPDAGSGPNSGYGPRGPGGAQQVPVEIFQRRGSSGLMALASPGSFSRVSPVRGTHNNHHPGDSPAEGVTRPPVAWGGGTPTNCPPNPASAAGTLVTYSSGAATGINTDTHTQPVASSSAGPNSTTMKSGLLLVVAGLPDGCGSSVPSGATGSLTTLPRTGSGTNAASNHARLPWLPRIMQGGAFGSRIGGESERLASAAATASHSPSRRQGSFDTTKTTTSRGQEGPGATDCGGDNDFARQLSAMRRMGLFRSFTATRKPVPRIAAPIGNNPREGATSGTPRAADDAAPPISTTESSEGVNSTQPSTVLNLVAGSSGGVPQHALSCGFQDAAGSSGGGRMLGPPAGYQPGSGSTGGIWHPHPQPLAAAIVAGSSDCARAQTLSPLSGRAPLASTKRRSHIKRYTSLDPLATSSWQVLFESALDNSSITLTTDGGDVTATAFGPNNILSTDETTYVKDLVTPRVDSATQSQMPTNPASLATSAAAAAAAAAPVGNSKSAASRRATTGDTREWPITTQQCRRLMPPAPAPSPAFGAACATTPAVIPHPSTMAKWFRDGSSTPRRQSRTQEEADLSPGASCAEVNPDSSGGGRIEASAESTDQAGDSHTDKLQPLEVFVATRRRMSSLLSCALAAAATAADANAVAAAATTTTTVTAQTPTPTPASAVSLTSNTPQATSIYASSSSVPRRSIDIPQPRPSALSPSRVGSVNSSTPPRRQSRPGRSSSALQLYAQRQFQEQQPDEKLRPASQACTRLHRTVPVARQQQQQQQQQQQNEQQQPQHLHASHLSLGSSFGPDGGVSRSPQRLARPASRTSVNHGSLANSPVPTSSRVLQFANSLRTAPKSRASGTAAAHGGLEGVGQPRAATTVLGMAFSSVGASARRVRRVETSAELGSLVRQVAGSGRRSPVPGRSTMKRLGPHGAAVARAAGQYGNVDAEHRSVGGAVVDELLLGGGSGDAGGSGGVMSERVLVDGTALAVWTRSSVAGLNKSSLGSGLQDLELELALELETLRVASAAPQPGGAVCTPGSGATGACAGAGSENASVDCTVTCNGLGRHDHARPPASALAFGVVRVNGGTGGGDWAAGGAGVGPELPQSLPQMGPIPECGVAGAQDVGMAGDGAKTKLVAWHEIRAAILRPVSGSGERYLVLLQKDVTAKVEAERHIAQVSECEHRLLEQIFPRHVLAYMTEEGFDRHPPPSLQQSPPPQAPPRTSTGTAPAHATSMDKAAAVAANPPCPPCVDSGSESGAFATERGSTWRPYVRDYTRLATWHEQVTVLFADIQGFTPMCKQLPPAIVMKFLNDLFVRFDARLDKYGVYKVETIGDCYVVAGGLIREDDDGMAAVAGSGEADPQQADKVVAFAQAMLRCASRVVLPTTGQPVRIRVGIHSGPVVSGVVGTRMPRFCLFGDTINTASRMESTGTAGCIHVSSDTFAMLSDRAPGWAPTGGIEVKGKGLMVTYLWTNPSLSSSPSSSANSQPTAITPPLSAPAHRPPSYNRGHTNMGSAGVSSIAPAATSNSVPSASRGVPVSSDISAGMTPKNPLSQLPLPLPLPLPRISSTQALGGGAVATAALPCPGLMLVPSGSSPVGSSSMMIRAAATTAAHLSAGGSGVATGSSVMEMAASGGMGSGAGAGSGMGVSSSSRGGPMQWWTTAGGLDSGYVIDISLGPNASWMMAAAQAAQTTVGGEGAAAAAATAVAEGSQEYAPLTLCGPGLPDRQRAALPVLGKGCVSEDGFTEHSAGSHMG